MSIRLFVKLHHSLMDAPAWRAMSAHARCLYPVLRRRHNNTRNNNGEIFLSHRDAEKELGFCRPCIAACFQELEHYGFAVMTRAGCLGVDGKGRAPHYRLTELETAEGPATLDFMKWTGTRHQRPQRQPKKKAGGKRPKKNKTPASAVGHPG